MNFFQKMMTTRKFKKVVKKKNKENNPSGGRMSKKDEKQLKLDKEIKMLRKQKTELLMNTPDKDLNGPMLRTKKKYLWALEQ